ncbi:MAG: flagellar hook-associated protein FlgK, partial [Candidatus Eisenbacteria bacterium]|nr:flagellar hook-associated protein FlgK [Candidatus Eisenbacteria bacterium]
MPGLIRSLEIARRSLLAHQGSLSVIGHNIANVSTPGYTRRTAVLEPSAATVENNLGFGSGVDLVQVSRQRDAFLDREVRRQKSLHGQWDVLRQQFSRLEALVAEPSDSSLGAVLDSFFDAWMELANQPESQTLRKVVVAEGQRLTERFQHLAAGIASIRGDSDERLAGLMTSLNQDLQEIARLNQSIQTAGLRGDQAPDLKDQRDALMERIVSVTGAAAREDDAGMVILSLDGHQLVDGVRALSIESRREVDDGGVIHRFYVRGREIHMNGGEAGGLEQMRDAHLPGLEGELDRLAQALAVEV